MVYAKDPKCSDLFQVNPTSTKHLFDVPGFITRAGTKKSLPIALPKGIYARPIHADIYRKSMQAPLLKNNTLFLHHETRTLADFDSLITIVQAKTSAVSIGYKNKDKKLAYPELVLDEFVSFSDDVLMIAKNISEISDGKVEDTVENYAAFTEAIDSIEVAKQNHETFQTLSKKYKVILQQLTKVNKFKIIFSKTSKGEFLPINANSNTQFLMQVKKGTLYLTVEDKQHESFITVPIHHLELKTEFQSLKKSNNYSVKLKIFINKAIQYSLQQIKTLTSYDTEVYPIYEAIGHFYNKKDLQSVIDEALKIEEINEIYLNK